MTIEQVVVAMAVGAGALAEDLLVLAGESSGRASRWAGSEVSAKSRKASMVFVGSRSRPEGGYCS